MRRKLAPRIACLVAALAGVLASPAGGVGAMAAAAAVLALLAPLTDWDAPSKDIPACAGR